MKQPHIQQDDLVFVNISRPDEIKAASTQRTIRRTVMRDIGRSRRTQRKPRTWALSVRQTINPSRTAVDPLPSLTNTSVPASIDPCNTAYYPVHLDDRDLQLLHFMTSDKDYVFRPFRSVWFSMALTDPSAIFVALANAAMFFDQRVRAQEFKYETSSACLAYYGRCVQQVRARLGSVKESLSEGVITAVLGLICHDLYVGMGDRWNTQFTGLERIIRCRGGYHGLSPNVALFAFWLDVVGSVAEDARPRMPKPLGLAAYLDAAPPDVIAPSVRDLLDDLSISDGAFCDVVVAFNYVISVAITVDGVQCDPEPSWQREDSLTIIKLFGPATHFLLSMSRPMDLHSSPQETKFLREAIRLALLLLLAALKKDVFRFTSSEWPHLQRKFTALVAFIPLTKYDALCLKLYLWALVTVSLVTDPEPIDLYTVGTRSVISSLGIDVNDALKLVKSILWVDALHIQTDQFISHLSELTCT
ncbi:hypothetical protein ASPACDRAFT_41702 [Aspergillus aculeatus ATCC 16872]|uniref:Transcription factor domain-containing protein n=1 Tax=Aspergillus aculeatus (strain ATCC 16872 / CBS 172.66 / WB 5094) TaxID=690307 RepID=A0A1L9WZ11_ASPA1|nr:uncharacterized protein ASPACDRAFT_41702 [Aspergillus aculeatus ATCC 16872]OJK01441.1 hypothetical protein ASPACDRAFT_41702 [Aspergillus aculeatus ATCC 16872]